MFQKILIANRGEIACRIIATAKRLGIETVAVYSEADANAKHVALADEAFCLGPPPVAESYLRGDLILACARTSGAQAIHPGYGFLAENPKFVAQVEQAGLTFIGPSAQAIQAMGLKDAAKTLMAEAGIPVVPGYSGVQQDPDFLAEAAAKIGYPVLIKARAGGGGKGMRKVETHKTFQADLASAQREAKAAFGDDVCLIEKYIATPRHIEVQIFGDTQGRVVHLFERDCSLQRRHQKVIEEAPAPGMPAAVRAAMGKAAVDAAKAINYVGAGTVEFIVDGSGPLRDDGFWFMEMNTLLQVEHPVSEAITGLDFVELQLRVAAGEPLPFSQDELSIRGWAFEARVYAEDVAKGFLPATGRVQDVRNPAAVEFQRGPVRIDSGIRQGDTISPFYDPMIAKVIVHGPTRATALNKLTQTLAACRVGGTVTNLQFLAALSRHAGFAAGQVDTDLIARDLGSLTAQDPPSETVQSLAALAALGFAGGEPDLDDPLLGWRHWSPAHHRISLGFDDTERDYTVTLEGRNRFRVRSDTLACSLSLAKGADGQVRVQVDDHQTSFHVRHQGSSVEITQDGQAYVFTIPDKTGAGDTDLSAGDAIVAPMPGSVVAIDAREGEAVQAGARLVLLEAMKMEHALTAARDGIVEKVLVEVGDQVQDGEVLVRLVPHHD